MFLHLLLATLNKFLYWYFHSFCLQSNGWMVVKRLLDRRRGIKNPRTGGKGGGRGGSEFLRLGQFQFVCFFPGGGEGVFLLGLVSNPLCDLFLTNLTLFSGKWRHRFSYSQKAIMAPFFFYFNHLIIATFSFKRNLKSENINIINTPFLLYTFISINT